MRTDQQIYTLLGANHEILRILTGGIVIQGSYHFEAIEVKGLDRRSDGVLMPESTHEPIWVIEFQAQQDDNIYYRTLIEMGLVGERNPGRVIHGLIIFAAETLDPKTVPWHGQQVKYPDQPLRVVYLPDILATLAEHAPEHPLLAVFLPYLEDDLARLQAKAPVAYRSIEQSDLPPSTQNCLLAVFVSWFNIRFNTLSYNEVMRMLSLTGHLEDSLANRELIGMGEARGIEKMRRREAYVFLRQLHRRLGKKLPKKVEDQVLALPVDDLEALGEALLDFTELADLEDWLARLAGTSSDKSFVNSEE